MLNKPNRRHGAFTLVEIMIVVAIIAFLAAIAVPNFLRASKRSQATRVLEDMSVIDDAKDMYATENNKLTNAPVNFVDLVPYFKTGTRLAISGGADTVGNPITVNVIDTPPRISNSTYTNFSDVVDDSFWGSYY